MPELISIHALREEGDKCIEAAVLKIKQFLSTPSARRATSPYRGDQQHAEISIHALREEGDLLAPLCFELLHISIHALREEGDPEGG